MPNPSKIVDMHGRPFPLSESSNRFLNTGLSNGAASLTNPSLGGWNWWGGSPDDDIVQHLSVVRQRCRDITLNAPIVAGLINTIVTNVIGQGLIPEPVPDAELLGMDTDEAAAWKKQLRRLWEMFAESNNCDVCGRATFYELTQVACRSVLESGDIFATLPYVQRSGSRLDLKIQLIEADCVSDPYVADLTQIIGDTFGGVEVGQHGEVLAYWVATYHPLAKRHPFLRSAKNPLTREWVRVPVVGEETGRRNILHIMHGQRPGQRRGVPIIAPVVEATKVLDRYVKAELQAALVQSLFTAAIKTQLPEQAVGEWNAMSSQWSDDEYLTPSQRFYEQNGMIQMGAGTVGILAPGDEVQPVGVTHPSSGFAPFVEAQIKMISVACGIPYEMATMYFQSSFSASRAAINMATAGFKVHRDWMTYQFCQPVYDAFVTECVANGLIKAPGFFSDPLKRRAYCSAKWAGPGRLSIDPQKELAADGQAISLGVTTHAEIAAEWNGSDFTQNVSILHEEQKMMDANKWDTNPLNVASGYSDEPDGEIAVKPAKQAETRTEEPTAPTTTETNAEAQTNIDVPAVTFGVGGTQSVIEILTNNDLTETQKTNILVIWFGLEESQVKEMLKTEEAGGGSGANETA